MILSLNLFFKGQRNIVKFLIDSNCSPEIKNLHGQKALYWIVAKCPEIVKHHFLKFKCFETIKLRFSKAFEILNKYRICNKYKRRDEYHLINVEIEPYGEGLDKLPTCQTIVKF